MRHVALLLVSVAACAQGQDPSDVVDAPGQSSIDAPTVIDAPMVDVDAATDAAATDAAMTDAAMTDAAMTDAAATDAMVTDAMMTDAGTDGGVTNADTCTNPPDITAAAMQGNGTTINGDVTGWANNIQPVGTCTGFDNDGPDAIYVLNLPTAGRRITASLTCTWDCALEVVQPCALQPTCFDGSDIGTTSVESIDYTTTAAGVFYVIVDSWATSAFGPYTLTVRVQ